MTSLDQKILHQVEVEIGQTIQQTNKMYSDMVELLDSTNGATLSQITENVLKELNEQRDELILKLNGTNQWIKGLQQ